MKRFMTTGVAAALVGVLTCGMLISAEETQAVRVGALKGPTSMGIVSLGTGEEAEGTNTYEKKMVTAADELTALIINGEVDIALLPANVASVLYNKTEGGVKVIDINTLGVLYIVETGDAIKSIEDLKGKTVYLTGKGTSPDFVIQYLLSAHGLTTEDVKLEYKSEATEVVSMLTEDETAIGLLPQPFVTVAGMQNENLKIALDLTAEWEAVQEEEDGSSLLTGVTIVRTEYLEEHEDKVQKFMADHEASAAFTNENPELAAEMIAELGIVPKAPIAQKAIPFCNITYVDGEEMKEALGGYLEVLHGMDTKSVGGELPGDDFYYITE